LLLKNSILQIGRAKKIIKSNSFYSKDKYNWAKSIVDACLLISSASYYGVDIKFDQISTGYDMGAPCEFLNTLDDETNNPYIYFFTNYLQTNKPLLKENCLIGISITSPSQLISALTFSKLYKKLISADVKIVFGGNYITRLALDTQNIKHLFCVCDYIIRYEGEVSLHKLYDAITNNTTLETVPNLVYLNDQKVKCNTSGTVPIDDLAHPNFDGFPLDSYLMPQLILPIYTSRSCFGKCTFCTIPLASHGSYRVLKTEKVINMMAHLHKKYGVQLFDFIDETTLPSIMNEIAIALRKGNFHFRWYAETRFSKQFTREFCKNLYQGGCRKLQFGLESYNQRVLDLMQKNIQQNIVDPTLTNCMESKITVHLFFMIGFPSETKDEAEKTISYTKDILEKASKSYNNSYWTRGWGCFSLDKYSQVFANPELYGVHIDSTNPPHQISGLKYHSTIGMTVEFSKMLVRSSKNDYRSILKEKGYFMFHFETVNWNSEEESFLRICHSDDGDQNQLESTSAEISSNSNEIVLIELKHPFINNEKPGNTFYVFYDDKKKKVWENREKDFKELNHQNVKRYYYISNRQFNQHFIIDKVSGKGYRLSSWSLHFVRHLHTGLDPTRAYEEIKTEYPGVSYKQISNLLILLNKNN
jgi:radical SAM superfamily enzyme YgiQ (UPF0313 family)